MSLILTAMIMVTAFLALYWVFYGQRKHNEMINPKRKTKLKAILFDFDGVIIDSFERQYIIFNDLRKKFGLKNIKRVEFSKNLWGKTLEISTKNYFKEQSLKEMEDAYNNLIKKYKDKTGLLPDVKKVLEAIKKKNIKIGLVTNTLKDRTLNELRFHKIKNYFNTIITVDDVEKPKPYPDGILKACEKLKVMPDEVIYVGDTKIDYKAGKSAGCYFIGFNTHGDLIISELRDLLQIL